MSTSRYTMEQQMDAFHFLAEDEDSDYCGAGAFDCSEATQREWDVLMADAVAAGWTPKA